MEGAYACALDDDDDDDDDDADADADDAEVAVVVHQPPRLLQNITAPMGP